MTIFKHPELSDEGVVLHVPKDADAQARVRQYRKPARSRMVAASGRSGKPPLDSRASFAALSPGLTVASDTRHLRWTLAHLTAIVVLFVLFGGGT